MRIAIDLSQIIFGTGVSHYRYNLVKNLLSIDTQNEYLLYGGSLRQKGQLDAVLNSFKGNYKVKTFPVPPTVGNLIWNKFHVLPIEKLIGQVDLIHTSDWTEPPSIYPKITTVHDLIPLKYPKVTPSVVVSTHKKKLEWVYKESKKIIVPSISTKKDLMELGFDEGRIKVVYEAPNHSKATVEEVELIKKKYGIFDNYIITIGTNPRKNIKRMVEAYHLSKSGKNLKFIVIGENRDPINSHDRGIRFLGRVPDNDLAALLTGSEALVFASLYEGFGVPILDAFNCDVPVVTSNTSSMPEAAGDAAILVDPMNVNSIADGIEEALSKPKTLVAKGAKRVKDFSWKKTAEDTLEVYKNMLHE